MERPAPGAVYHPQLCGIGGGMAKGL